MAHDGSCRFVVANARVVLVGFMVEKVALMYVHLGIQYNSTYAD